jgi:hypothetical protein
MDIPQGDPLRRTHAAVSMMSTQVLNVAVALAVTAFGRSTVYGLGRCPDERGMGHSALVSYLCRPGMPSSRPR